MSLSDLPLFAASPAPERAERARQPGTVQQVTLAEALEASARLWPGSVDEDYREAAELAATFSRLAAGRTLPTSGLAAARLADEVMRDAWAGSRWWALFGGSGVAR